MISYQTYKLITESTFTLGLKSKPSIGITGSKLQEMGFEQDDDPEMLDDEMGNFPPKDPSQEMDMDSLDDQETDERGFPCPACNAEGENDEGMEGCEACGGMGWLPPEEGEEGEMGDLEGGEEGEMMDEPNPLMNGDKKPGEEMMFSKKFMRPEDIEDEDEMYARDAQSRNRGYDDDDDDDVQHHGQSGRYARPGDYRMDRPSRPAAMKKFMNKGCCNKNMKEESVKDDFLSSLTQQTQNPYKAKHSCGLSEDLLIAMQQKEPSPGEIGYAPQGRLNQIGSSHSNG